MGSMTPGSQANNEKAWGVIFDVFRACITVWKTQLGYALLTALLTISQGSLPACQLWISKLLVDLVTRTI